MDAVAVPAEAASEAARPAVREATALQVYNIPLFEVPPMLDVRPMESFTRSHIICAVAVPMEDGPSQEQLFRRILDHDEQFGWMLQHPMVVVYDEESQTRVSWLVNVLKDTVASRSGVSGFEGADSSESLLRRLAFQCKEVLLLRHRDFEATFPSCCAAGKDFAAEPLFERLGPLPRCALLEPRVYLAGRQVNLTAELFGALGITHVVTNADTCDVMDGTSGGGSYDPFADRPADVQGVRYLKCELADREGGDEVAEVLAGAARFMAVAASQGGVILLRVHGLSRTASLVCAFLVQWRGLALEQAWLTFQAAGIGKVDERLVWWGALRKLPPMVRALEDFAPPSS